MQTRLIVLSRLWVLLVRRECHLAVIKKIIGGEKQRSGLLLLGNMLSLMGECFQNTINEFVIVVLKKSISACRRPFVLISGAQSC